MQDKRGLIRKRKDAQYMEEEYSLGFSSCEEL
jgi:hypothetical protein